MFFGSSVALSDKVIKLAESLLEGHGQVDTMESSPDDTGVAVVNGGGGDNSKQHARAAVMVAGGPTRVVDGSLKELCLSSLALTGERF